MEYFQITNGYVEMQTIELPAHTSKAALDWFYEDCSDYDPPSVVVGENFIAIAHEDGDVVLVACRS